MSRASFRDLQKSVEVFAKCDLVTDLTNGHTVRMNHADEVRFFLKSCATHGANLEYNAAARANALEKTHGFLKQYFQIAG